MNYNNIFTGINHVFLLVLIYRTDFNCMYFGVDELAQVVLISLQNCVQNQVAFLLCISLNVTFNPVLTLLVLFNIFTGFNHVFDLSYISLL